MGSAGKEGVRAPGGRAASPAGAHVRGVARQSPGSCLPCPLNPHSARNPVGSVALGRAGLCGGGRTFRGTQGDRRGWVGAGGRWVPLCVLSLDVKLVRVLRGQCALGAGVQQRVCARVLRGYRLDTGSGWGLQVCLPAGAPAGEAGLGGWRERWAAGSSSVQALLGPPEHTAASCLCPGLGQGGHTTRWPAWRICLLVRSRCAGHSL